MPESKSKPKLKTFPRSRETCSFEAKNVFELAEHISAHDLRLNQRVKFREDSIEGTVIDVGYCAITVEWDDGQVGQISLCDFPRSVEVA